ncbi:MAG TPA: porin family protein [Puia sp.]|nr:porin family protein [Puia sp.]
MKGIGVCTLTMLLLTASLSSAYAQSSLQLGVRAGMDYMKIGGRSFDQKSYPGFAAGIYGKLNFTTKWYLQPELDYNQTIGKTSDQFNQIYNGVSDQLVNLNYVSVPVLLGFKPIPELSVLVGPQYGYLFAQTRSLLQAPTERNDNAFKKSDFAIVFGGQLNLNKIIFGIRYSANLNNISYRDTDAWRQYGFQFYVGYQFKDKKLK